MPMHMVDDQSDAVKLSKCMVVGNSRTFVDAIEMLYSPSLVPVLRGVALDDPCRGEEDHERNREGRTYHLHKARI